jgi:DNA-binding ferritin-like protein
MPELGRAALAVTLGLAVYAVVAGAIAAPPAGAHDDVSTADLATQRVTVHEKAAWMLESLLKP